MSKNSPKLHSLKPAKQAFRIAFIYFSLSMIWIIASDYYYFAAADASMMTLVVSTGKGFLYSLVSATILFLLLKKYFTSLYKSASELEQSSNQYRTLADNLSIGIVRRTTDKKCIYYNNYSRKIFSDISGFLNSGNPAGKTPLEDIKDPVLAGKIDSLLNEAISTGITQKIQLKLNDKILKTTVIPEFSKNGNLVSLLSMTEDITGQVKTEQNLLTKTGYLNSVIEASPMAVFDLDRNGYVVSIWNRAAEQIFGYTRDEAIGKLLPIVDSQMKDEFLQGLKTVFRTGEIKNMEKTRRTKDGSLIELSISTRALESENGNVTRIIAYDDDITLRKKYEQEISGYSNYLQLLYDTGLKTTGTLDLRETYSIIFDAVSGIVNSGTAVISSFNKNTGMLTCEAACIDGEMLDVAFLPELEISKPSAGLQSQAITSGRSHLVSNYPEVMKNFPDMTLFDSSGPVNKISSEEHILAQSAIIIPLKYKDKITGTLQVFSYDPVVFTNTDLRRLEPIAVLIAAAAERARLYKETQDEVEQKKIAFEQIRVLSKGIEQTPNSIIITNSSGIIEYVNPYFEELTGYSAGEVVGEKPSVLKSGKNRPEIYEDLWKTITSGEVWHGEFQNKKKNGELYWESASIGPITDENDVITNFIAVKQDITEKKLKDTQIRESLAEKEIMLKEIHHRVKNNLQIISSLLNMQLNHYNTPEAIDAIKAGRNRVKAMALVHENLYRSANISKTSMDDYIVTLAQNIYSAYGNTFEKVHFTRETGGIEFGLDTVIPLGLIINEAVSNSLKHAFPSDKSGEISVVLKKLQGLNYRLTVKDNGIGLPGNFDPNKTNSLGMTLITSLASQLDGKVILNNTFGTEMIVNFKEIRYKSRV